MKPWLEKINRVPVKPRPDGVDLRYSEWLTPPEFITEFIETLTWQDFVQYPDTNLLKKKIAEYHSVVPDNIFLGPGSAECIKAVFDCFDSTDSVITTFPCFPMYEVYAAQNNLQITRMWPKKDYSYSTNRLVGGHLAVISRPSNPVGSIISRDDVICLLEQDPERWVLIDEAYIDYAPDAEDITSLIGQYKNLIISRSFSKTFGAAGIRVGYLLSNNSNIETITALRQMYEVSAPAMRYAMFLIDHIDSVKEYCLETHKEKVLLATLFHDAGYRTVSSGGNWMHVEQTVKLTKLLSTNSIHVKEDIILPYSDNTWIRLTVGPGVHKLFKQFIQET